MRALSFLRDGHIMIFHVDVFPPLSFLAGFSPLVMRHSPLPPLLPVSAPQTPPSLDFSEYFLLMHTYTHIYVTDSVFPPLTSYRFS